jgi:hypothetical protein
MFKDVWRKNFRANTICTKKVRQLFCLTLSIVSDYNFCRKKTPTIGGFLKLNKGKNIMLRYCHIIVELDMYLCGVPVPT